MAFGNFYFHKLGGVRYLAKTKPKIVKPSLNIIKGFVLFLVSRHSLNSSERYRPSGYKMVNKLSGKDARCMVVCRQGRTLSKIYFVVV